MTGWLIFAVYVAGWAVTSRLLARIMLNSEDFGDGDQVDNVLAKAFASLVAIAWPLALCGIVVFVGLPKTDRQLRAELVRRQQRIKQLEDELGIDRREAHAS